MPKLPAIVDFNEAAFPGLEQIFREVDCAIAAIIASDPAFRIKRANTRRGRTTSSTPGAVPRRRSAKRVAA